MTTPEHQVVDEGDAGISIEILWRFTTAVPMIPSQARLVFIASCDVGNELKTWWNIDSNTNRFLIVPNIQVYQLTDLYWGAQAWKLIAQLLRTGYTVAEAVAGANQMLVNNGRANQQYIVVGRNGGAGVRIR
jgi:hypothetical protein